MLIRSLQSGYVPKTLFVHDTKSGMRSSRLRAIARALASHKAGWIPAHKITSDFSNQYDLLVIQHEAFLAYTDQILKSRAALVVDISQSVTSPLPVHGFLVEHEGQARQISGLNRPWQYLNCYVDSASWAGSCPPFATVGFLPGSVYEEDVQYIKPVLEQLRQEFPELIFVFPEQFRDCLPFPDADWLDAQTPLDRMMMANRISIGLLPSVDTRPERTRFALLEHAQARSAVVASPFYESLIRSPTRGAIVRSQEEWQAKIREYILTKSRRSVSGSALYDIVSTRYSPRQGYTYGVEAIRQLYRTIIGSFRVVSTS